MATTEEVLAQLVEQVQNLTRDRDEQRNRIAHQEQQLLEARSTTVAALAGLAELPKMVEAMKEATISFEGVCVTAVILALGACGMGGPSRGS